MPIPAPRIFIAGYYGFGNAGDEAILAGMIAALRARRPGAEFIIASGDPAATEAEHGVGAVHRDDLPAVVEVMRGSDLVVLGGGGLLQDYWDVPTENVLTPRSGGLPFYAGFPILAALLGKPAMVYAVGVGPLATEEGRRLARGVFEMSAGATVRDEGSLALLAELGVKAGLAADPAFGLAPAPDERLDALWAELGLEPGERPVGICLRPWTFHGEGWEAEVAAGLDRFLASSRERLLFLPFQADEDVPAHRRVLSALQARDRAVVLERTLPPAELAGLVRRCGRVLAMRYHAALFGLAGGVPVAALAYDPKVHALFAEAGLEDSALPPDAWTADAIAAALAGARGPGYGFTEGMRRRAERSAEAALEALERGRPAPSFLDELTVRKALSSFRLETELGSTIEALRLGLARTEGELESTRAAVRNLESERAGLREQRDLVLAERNDLERRLSALEGTLAYRLASRFWALTRRLFPEGSRRRKLYRLGRRLFGKAVGGAAAADAPWREGMGGAPAGAVASGGPDPRADLLDFEARVRASGAKKIVAIFSATQLLESEGQRPTQLALALARRGVPVAFIYWRWWDNEWRPQDRLEDGIVQIPIDVVTRRPEMIAGALEGLERIALFEFPHPGFFETLSALNSSGWITAYDVLDDWEEFHRVGQAIWYDDPFERHLIDACDAVFAINDFLAGRIRELGGGLVEVVGNGLKPGLEVVREPRPLERGEVTIGYFGYLAGAWFDWELIAEAARRRPSWRFYLIGYGGSPEGVTLPETVRLLGKQPQTDLAAYAANWDVALIPFKPDRLAAGADPIKTYEYLAMGLPVVAAGVYPPMGGEAFVTRAEGVEGFLREVERAAARVDAEEVAARRAFAGSCTWDHRLEALLASIEEGRQRVAEKRALLGSGA
ncbi:MAG: polysaccharide pyruvyl transferase CsaB [Thermoanaerobaculia bacterium]